MDAILATASAMHRDAELNEPSGIGRALVEFEADHALEKFTSYEELCEYWSSPTALQRLKSGELGKLNSLHGLQLISQQNEFLEFLLGVAEEFLGEKWEQAEPIFKEVIRFTRSLIVDVQTPHAAALI